MSKPIKSPTHYITLAVYTPEEVYEKMKSADFFIFNKFKVNIGSDRVKLFRSNPYCVHCNVEGVKYCLQRGKKEPADTTPHLNLYAIDSEGNDLLMTKDHIIPKSKGGKNSLTNYQTLCIICNANKEDKLPI